MHNVVLSPEALEYKLCIETYARDWLWFHSSESVYVLFIMDVKSMLLKDNNYNFDLLSNSTAAEVMPRLQINVISRKLCDNLS